MAPSPPRPTRVRRISILLLLLLAVGACLGWYYGILAPSTARPSANSLMVISPYYYNTKNVPPRSKCCRPIAELVHQGDGTEVAVVLGNVGPSLKGRAHCRGGRFDVVRRLPQVAPLFRPCCRPEGLGGIEVANGENKAANEIVEESMAARNAAPSGLAHCGEGLAIAPVVRMN